jgi:hypothetical protein
MHGLMHRTVDLLCYLFVLNKHLLLLLHHEAFPLLASLLQWLFRILSLPLFRSSLGHSNWNITGQKTWLGLLGCSLNWHLYSF